MQISSCLTVCLVDSNLLCRDSRVWSVRGTPISGLVYQRAVRVRLFGPSKPFCENGLGATLNESEGCAIPCRGMERTAGIV